MAYTNLRSKLGESPQLRPRRCSVSGRRLRTPQVAALVAILVLELELFYKEDVEVLYLFLNSSCNGSLSDLDQCWHNVDTAVDEFSEFPPLREVPKSEDCIFDVVQGLYSSTGETLEHPGAFR